MIQQSMFSDLVPEYEVVAEPEQRPTLVERPPGWTLIVGKRGPTGWHRVKGYGAEGLRVTHCGIKGRALTEDEPQITICAVCAVCAKA